MFGEKQWYTEIIYTGYFHSKIRQHREGHTNKGIPIIPTSVYHYRDLTEQCGVHDWFCRVWDSASKWDLFDRDGHAGSSPLDPYSRYNGVLVPLIGLHPDAQQQSNNGERDA